MGKEVVSPLRQRMTEDMNARKLGKHSQRSHIHSRKRFAAFLKRLPETATPDDIRRFQLHLIESGLSICNRNRVMTGVKFLVRVTLRRLDLAAEIFHLREPQRIPLVMSQDETRRLLAVAGSLKLRVLLSLGYGCGLRAGEVVRLKVKHIDSAQKIIRVEQSKGRKDRNVMLSPETLDLLRQWWKTRRRGFDSTTPMAERWLFPGQRPGKPMTTRQLNRLFHEAADAAGIRKGVTLHAACWWPRRVAGTKSFPRSGFAGGNNVRRKGGFFSEKQLPAAAIVSALRLPTIPIAALHRIMIGKTNSRSQSKVPMAGVSCAGRFRHHAMPVSIAEIDHEADGEPHPKSQPGGQRQAEHQQQ